MATSLFSFIALFALFIGSDACGYEAEYSVFFKEYDYYSSTNSDAIYNFEYGSEVSIVYDNGENLIYSVNDVSFTDMSNNNNYKLLNNNNNNKVRDEYQNYYSFFQNGICIELKISELTPLTDNKNIICRILSEVRDIYNYEILVVYSSARIIGYNNMDNTNPKYVKSDGNEVYPFNSELRFYCYGYGENDNISVHLIDQNNASTMIVNNSMVVSGMEDDYEIERRQFNTFLFTMNELTESMNNSMVICNDSRDGTKIHTFNVMGFHLDDGVTTTFPDEGVTTMFPEDVTTMFPEDVTTMFPEDVTTMLPDEGVTTMLPDEDYESITDPRCVIQQIESNIIPHNNLNEATHNFFCAVKQSNPPASVSYYFQTRQFTIDMTDQMVVLNNNNDISLFKLPLNNLLFVNNNNFVTCNVTQPPYGNYPEVVKSCTFEQN